VILYNKNFKERARQLRKAKNLAEVIIWNRLKDNQFMGLIFNRQKSINNFVVDFYCYEKSFVIEIDGSSHDDKQESDRERDEIMKCLELNVVRIKVDDVLNRINKVMKLLRVETSKLESWLNSPFVKGGGTP